MYIKKRKICPIIHTYNYNLLLAGTKHIFFVKHKMDIFWQTTIKHKHLLIYPRLQHIIAFKCFKL